MIDVWEPKQPKISFSLKFRASEVEDAHLILASERTSKRGIIEICVKKYSMTHGILVKMEKRGKLENKNQKICSHLILFYLCVA